MNRRGFTLLELLIVIAILAVLATVAVLVINPMEYIKQSRDTKRIADMASLSKALSLVEFENLSLGGASTTIYVSLVNAAADCSGLGLPALPTGYQYHCVTVAANLNKVDSTGWIPVNLTALTGKSPLGSLPVDPVNNTTNFYTYIPGGSYALSATLESDKYLKQSALTDGGTNPGKIEMGSDLKLLTKADGLVGYWPLDEGSGVGASDVSGNANNGTFTGAPLWVGGKVGGALSFDGISDYVSIPHTDLITATSGDFTVAFWTIQNNPHPVIYPRIIGKGDYNTAGWQIIIDKATNAAYFQSFQAGAGQSVSLGIISNTAFMHVAVTKTGTTVRTYINGSPLATGTIVDPLYSNRPLTIGASHPATATELSKGVTDDVRLYDRALSAAEIKAMYSAAK